MLFCYTILLRRSAMPFCYAIMLYHSTTPFFYSCFATSFFYSRSATPFFLTVILCRSSIAVVLNCSAIDVLLFSVLLSCYYRSAILCFYPLFSLMFSNIKYYCLTYVFFASKGVYLIHLWSSCHIYYQINSFFFQTNWFLSGYLLSKYWLVVSV